ncbi:MAG: hypothetical protein HZC01_00530 [Candidatus Kerfeldbacteria bacterium]|nr:hypothetical protein [Candidatus Kerfeldbacteria bacterium]
MYPRIISLLIVACAMIFTSTSCYAVQKRNNTGCEVKAAPQSVLYRVFLAYPGANKSVGAEIWGIIKVKGDYLELVFDWDEPRGSLTSDASPTGFWFKWGDGQWIRAKRERHGSRYILTITNLKNNKEAMLSVRATFKEVSTGYDEYGEQITNTRENAGTAITSYKVKFYKN